MKKLDFESLMRSLSTIPGLKFLDTWLGQVKGTATRFSQRKGDLEAYRDVAREGFSDVHGAVTGDEDADSEDEREGGGSYGGGYGGGGYREDDYRGDVYSDDDYEY